MIRLAVTILLMVSVDRIDDAQQKPTRCDSKIAWVPVSYFFNVAGRKNRGC